MPGLRSRLCELEVPWKWYAATHTSPLYPYQLEAAEGIEKVVELCRTGQIPASTLVFMCSRQGGKNETIARVKARLLCKYANSRGNNNIVMTAPTLQPQLVNAMLRLESMLRQIPMLWKAAAKKGGELKALWQKLRGYKYILQNAMITFLSGDPDAERVSETIGVLLVVDEAQRYIEQIYKAELRPMLATTNAATLMQGTSWIDTNLLEKEREKARSMQLKNGRPRLLFEYPWWYVAEQNPLYALMAQAERAELGEDNPFWQSQWELKPVAAMGRLFSKGQLENMEGEYSRRHRPARRRGEDEEEEVYVAGVDFNGMEEQDPDEALRTECPWRDSTVATVAKLGWKYNQFKGEYMPVLHVVDHLYMPKVHVEHGVDRLSHFLFEVWNVRRAVCDNKGCGKNPTARLVRRHGAGRVIALSSTLEDVTRMGHGLIAAAETGRIKVYRESENDSAEDLEALREWQLQSRLCERHLLGNQKMRFQAPTSRVDGKVIHDDFVKSLGYCWEAAAQHLANYKKPESPQAETWKWGVGHAS